MPHPAETDERFKPEFGDITRTDVLRLCAPALRIGCFGPDEHECGI